MCICAVQSNYIDGYGVVMVATKTETLTVRVKPAVKAELKAAAAQERRSLANMIEVMISDYNERHLVETSGLCAEEDK